MHKARFYKDINNRLPLTGLSLVSANHLSKGNSPVDMRVSQQLTVISSACVKCSEV